MTVGFKIKAGVILYKFLYKEFGFFKTITLLIKLMTVMIFKNPWKGVSKPRNQKEQFSQNSLTPLIHLFGVLKKQLSNKQALSLMKTIIIKTSILFMQKMIPVIKAAQLKTMEKKERKEYLKKTAEGFFNAEISNITISDQKFTYDITCCYFVDLLKKINLSELAPFFCEADYTYFADHQPEVIFKRTQTLAENDKECDFNFSLK